MLASAAAVPSAVADGTAAVADAAPDTRSDHWPLDAGPLDVHHSPGVGHHIIQLLSEGSGAKTAKGAAYDSPAHDGSTLTGTRRLPSPASATGRPPPSGTGP
ncbi:hypothetical protein [Streptomyces sp. DH12]|uniref:hypothetical protein n=1 Tax=Streptomyces sp. DH12 TaxID=2857010 RepID=UPI001E495138|nr:hypothetical protein [Streptomyces sp. DH12]